MSVNNFKAHVLVLPEDKANQDIANGFLMEPSLHLRNIQILPPAGGWPAIRDSFERVHNRDRQKYPKRLMVLLVDFDEETDRREAVTSQVLDMLRDRVFVLGAYSEPEKLKAELGSYETIGKALASNCADGTSATWEHPLLKHNKGELDRMMPGIKEILFG